MIDEHPLIRFNIPAAFVVARAIPTAAELAYGFRDGWLTCADVVAVALAKYNAGRPLTAVEEQLALLLSDELDCVDDLIPDLGMVNEHSERQARIWLFLALAWLLEHNAQFDDPLQVIEMLYTDFHYPDEIRQLVRFVPAGVGDEVGVDVIDRKWRAFVDRVGAEYRQRDLAAR